MGRICGKVRRIPAAVQGWLREVMMGPPGWMAINSPPSVIFQGFPSQRTQQASHLSDENVSLPMKMPAAHKGVAMAMGHQRINGRIHPCAATGS